MLGSFEVPGVVVVLSGLVLLLDSCYEFGDRFDYWNWCNLRLGGWLSGGVGRLLRCGVRGRARGDQRRSLGSHGRPDGHWLLGARAGESRRQGSEKREHQIPLRRKPHILRDLPQILRVRRYTSLTLRWYYRKNRWVNATGDT